MTDAALSLPSDADQRAIAAIRRKNAVWRRIMRDPAAAAVTLPHEMLTVDLPTLVVWALDDIALPPELIDGLGDYVADLTLHTVPGATHWIVHEQPQRVAQYLQDFLLQNK